MWNNRAFLSMISKWLLVMSFMFFTVGSVLAQETVVQEDPIALDKLAQDLTPQERLDLMARLSDADIREMLINYLNQAGLQAEEATDVMHMMEKHVDVIRENMARLISRTPDIMDAFTQAQDKISQDKGIYQVFVVLGLLLAVMAVAYAIESLFRRMMIRKTKVADGKGSRSLTSIIDLVALGVFGFITLIGFLIFYEGHVPSRILFLTYFSAVMIVRLTMVASRFILSPKYPHLRFFNLDDQTAIYWNREVLLLAFVGAFGFLSCGLMARLGIDNQLHKLLLIMVGIIFIAVLVRAIWNGRKSMTELILGDIEVRQNAGIVKRAFASSWHFIVIAYVVAVFVFAIISSLAGSPIGLGGVLISLAMVVLLPVTDAFVAKALKKSFEVEKPIMASTEVVTPEMEEVEEILPSSTKVEYNSYARILIRAARLLLIIGAFLILANLWGVDFFGMAQNGLGNAVMRVMLDIGLTGLLAYVAWEFIKAAIDKHLAEEAGSEEAAGEAEGGAGGSRLVTLLPLIRKFLFATIAVMTTMIILSSLGVDIGPMIAGAGVIGLAVGFGAQTLVKDIVSGIFFLVDDAFRVQEYVDVGSVKGTVERINVRSLTLRHHLGPLHTIPFGEIGHLTNFSRDWVIVKMMFRVTYDTDMKKVKNIFKKIGAELLENEMIADGFIEPFKSQGVKEMTDSAMIIRAKFKAKPGTQFMIRKEAYQLVQKRFAENGIEFAHRRVQVDLPDHVDPNSELGQHLKEAGSAAAASEEEKPDAAGKPAS